MTDLPTDTRTVWDVLRSPRRGPHYMGMVSPIYYTADMVRALPEDGNRYEVVHGELLVTPAPRLWHEEVAARLQERVREYLRREPVGLAIGSRSDLSWGLKDVLVSPDLFVVPLAEARKDDWMALHTVLLVAEVLSPSSLKTDRFTKRRLYQEMGVSLYWIVDPTESQVEVWLPRDDFPRFEREELAWQPIGAETRFQVRLEELFRPI
ncbi:MAG: Uma2 family endonuclease [Gemmatimonadota bacterium]